MEKRLIFVYFLIGLTVSFIVGLLVLVANDKANEKKEILESYAEKLYESVLNLSTEEANSKLQTLKTTEEVTCGSVILTDNKELLLNKCSINDSDKKYCYYKDKVYSCDNKNYKKIMLNLGLNENNTTYQAGDLVKVKVGENEIHSFYVLEQDDNTITAILDRNLVENITWVTEEDVIEAGYDIEFLLENVEYIRPFTAEKELKKQTSTWTNTIEVRIPKAYELLQQTDRYKGKEMKDWQTDYRNKTILNCGTTHCRQESKDVLLPEWLTANLVDAEDDPDFEKDSVIYLTDTMGTGDFQGFLYFVGISDGFGAVFLDEVISGGIRPVIKIDKSYIVE